MVEKKENRIQVFVKKTLGKLRTWYLLHLTQKVLFRYHTETHGVRGHKSRRIVGHVFEVGGSIQITLLLLLLNFIPKTFMSKRNNINLINLSLVIRKL